MKQLTVVAMILLATWPCVLLGQATSKVLQAENAMVRAAAQRVSPNGTVYFRQGLEVRPEVFLEENKSHLGLTPVDDMRLSREQSGGVGEVAHRFQQYHKEIPVEGAQYVIHVRDGELVKLRGRVAEGLDIEVSRSIPEEVARGIALDSLTPRDLPEKSRPVDPAVLNSPPATGEQVIVRDPAASEESFVLAYVFSLPAPDAVGEVRVYVDAATGLVLKKISSPTSNAAVGTVVTQYNGTRSFATRKRGWPNNDYVLQDHTRGEITTKNDPWSWGLGAQVTDGDNYWPHNEASAHWAVQKSHDYFKDVHFRNGVNNGNEEIRIYAKADRSSYSDFGNHSVICLTAQHTTLDVAGHEFTHGVIHHTSGLLYERESGALNESFADIFGTLVERQFRGGFSFDWRMAGEAAAIRDLQNPLLFGQPDTFGVWPWFQVVGCAPDCSEDGNDCCGVHTNSGVQNQWFSLLVDGGFHNGIFVAGIGPVAAGRIAYRNMTLELFAGADHQDAREGAIDAAETLYGECSNAVEQVTNAWAAVGVGAPFGTCVPQLFGSISGDEYGETGTLLNWTASASGGVPPYSYSWRVDGVFAGSGSSLSRVFLVDGFYFIEMTVIDSAFQSTTVAKGVVVGSCEDDAPDCAVIQ